MSLVSRTLAFVFSTGLLVSLAASPVQAEIAKSAVQGAKHNRDIQFLREEEKLARDVYRTLYKRWNLQIFENISQAEQRHLDRMGTIITRYKIDDPIRNDNVGVFANAKLASLYKELVVKGSKSEVDALLVGATIEDLDIRDIRGMRQNTIDRDTLDAFAKLECGSRNHMRAFTRQLASRGVTYKAKFLSSRDIGAIVNASQEQCGRGQNGARGRGMGGHGMRSKRGQDNGHDGMQCGHGGKQGRGHGGDAR